MADFMDFPFLVCVLSFALMWGAALVGYHYVGRKRGLEEEERSSFTFIVGATLTLLGLIIGFSFSMAIGRYDQRKSYEEEEANAIGTEYVRAEMLRLPDAENVQTMLRHYLDLRIEFYEVRNPQRLVQVNAAAAQSQSQMWSAVKSAAVAQPTPLSALAVAGMNDVLNRQGYTQAAWWNRIPVAAWTLMITIAVCCNVLVGCSIQPVKSKIFLLILPLVVAISFLLLSDLDSPRGGIIRVHPQNLMSLARSLQR